MHPRRPSRTARKISETLVFLEADPELAPLLPPGTGEANRQLLAAAGFLKPWMVALVRKPVYRRFVGSLERRLAPGQILYVGLRKRLIDDGVRDALGAGARQVLVLGAGLDTLALRLAPEHPDRAFVELDHPNSLGAKQRALEKLGIAPPNLHLVPADLAARGLARVLQGIEPWDGGTPSVAVAEGLLMYLEEAAVTVLLEDLHRSTGPGSSLFLTHMRPDARGRPHLGPTMASLTRLSLRWAREPLKWTIDPGELGPFLAARGWELEEGPIDLRSRYLQPAGLGDRPLGEFEFTARARRA